MTPHLQAYYYTANLINDAYQSGGDAETLCRVAYDCASLYRDSIDIAAFLDICAMGGLNVWTD